MGTRDRRWGKLGCLLAAVTAWFSPIGCTSADGDATRSSGGGRAGTGELGSGGSASGTGGGGDSATGGARTGTVGGRGSNVGGGTLGSPPGEPGELGGAGEGGTGEGAAAGGTASSGAGGSAGAGGSVSAAGAVGGDGGMPASAGALATGTEPVVTVVSCAPGEQPPGCLPGARHFAPSNAVSLLAAAGLEEEGALLLRETLPLGNGEVSTRVMLQRIEATGARIGEALEISASREVAPIVRMSIAGDGERYFYCLSSQSDVTCGLFEPPLAHTPQVFEAAGQSVAVAFTQDTWLVGYRTLRADPEGDEPVELVLQTFSRDGLDPGPTLRLATHGEQPVLTATETEFVLVASYAEHAFAPHVFWLDPELRVTRAPVALDARAAVAGGVAATAELVVVSSAFAYHSVLSLLGPASPLRTHVFDGGGKMGAYYALAATGGTITASCFTRAGSLVATTFSSPDQVPPELVASDEHVWLTFSVGERVLGARIFGSASALEVVPLPVPSPSAE